MVRGLSRLSRGERVPAWLFRLRVMFRILRTREVRQTDRRRKARLNTWLRNRARTFRKSRSIERSSVRVRTRVSKTCRSEEHTSELQSHSFISYAVFCLK